MKEAKAWRPLQLLSTIFFFFFRSLTEPALTNPDRLAANELWWLPESESSTQVFAVTLAFWHRCWGSELRFSCLQVLYPWSHSPSPQNPYSWQGPGLGAGDTESGPGKFQSGEKTL